MRARSWWAWVLLPLRSPSVAMSLIGALALPALLLASGPMFRRSASDEITVRVLGGLEPAPAGLTVDAEGPFDAERLSGFSVALEDRLARIDGLAAASRTLLSDGVAVTAVDGTAVEVPPGPGDVRVMARPGATEAVEVLEGDSAGGALVPASLATTYGLSPGSVVALGSADVRVGGIYRDLWDGEPSPYWGALPRDLVPHFLRAFDQPEFELVLTDEATARSLGLSGRARWEAPLVDAPDTWAGFEQLAGAYRAAESALTGSGPLGEGYRRWASDPEHPPSVNTVLYDAEEDAARLVAELEQPVQTAAWAGTVAGVLLSTLGAVYLVRRRRTDHRLMAADGDAWWRFAGRAVAQYALPALAGTVAGVALAWVVIRFLGPSGTATLAAVPWLAVVAVSLLAVVLAAVVTAVISVRLADGMDRQIGSIDRTWLLVLAGVVVTMWVQVGRGREGGVNPLVVAFPLVGVLTGVLVVVAVLRAALRSARRSGARLPTSLFLAWRALTASEPGALLLTAAIGSAAGLAVLSLTFVETIDAATDAKAATVAGAVSRFETRDNIDVADLPSGSTVVRSLSTEVGDRSVEVLAIDPDTYPDAVAWSDLFGGDPAEIVDLLGTSTPGAVPALAVGGHSVPASGEFGIRRVFPYEVVGTVASAPMASTTSATLVVRADVFERFARDRWDRGGEEIDPVDQNVAQTLGRTIEYQSPLDAYSDNVLSTRSLDEMTALAATMGWQVGETETLAGQRGSVDAQSTRWAFDYLGILAAIGGVTALGVMAFYLAERRSQREVATVMTQQMGVPHRTNVAAAMAEMVGLVLAAIAAGVVAAVVSARRVFPIFEPDPEVPPTVALIVDGVAVVGLFVGAVLAVAAIAAWSQRSVSNADKAQVLRG